MAKFSWNKGAATAAQFAPIGFKVGGPAGALAGAGVGLIAGGATGVDNTLNRKGYLDAHNRYAKNALSQTRRATKEMGSRIGQNLAARGINDSALSEYINQSNRGRMTGRTLDHIATRRADLEMQLAHAQEMLNQARSRDERQAWANTTSRLYQWLTLEYFKDIMGGDQRSIIGRTIDQHGKDLGKPESIVEPEGLPERDQRERPNVPITPRPITGEPDALPPVPSPEPPPRPEPPAEQPIEAPAPPQPPAPPAPAPGAPSREDGRGSAQAAGPIISPNEEFRAAVDPNEDPEGIGRYTIFTPGADGKIPEVGTEIGLDLEGDLMYEGWEKYEVYVASDGSRWARYRRISGRDDIRSPDEIQPLSYDSISPTIQSVTKELEKTLGAPVTNYLQRTFGDEFAKALMWEG